MAKKNSLRKAYRESIPIHKEQVCYRSVTDLQRTDLLQAYHKSVFETVTGVLLISYMPITEQLEVCYEYVLYWFLTTAIHSIDRLCMTALKLLL